MRTFTRKGYGRIYVKEKDHIEKVKETIEKLDAQEHGYMPSNLITTFEEYPRTVYLGKFDELDLDDLQAICWHIGIDVFCFNANYFENAENALKKYSFIFEDEGIEVDTFKKVFGNISKVINVHLVKEGIHKGRLLVSFDFEDIGNLEEEIRLFTKYVDNGGYKIITESRHIAHQYSCMVEKKSPKELLINLLKQCRFIAQVEELESNSDLDEPDMFPVSFPSLSKEEIESNLNSIRSCLKGSAFYILSNSISGISCDVTIVYRSNTVNN